MNDETTKPVTALPPADFNAMALEALTAACDPARVQEIVAKKITETVDRAIEDATRSYSPFGQALEGKLKDALSIQNLNLPSYNTIICSMVQKAVEANVSELIAGRLKTDLDAMLAVAPKTIKLSEIVTSMRSEHEGNDYGPVVTCHVDQDGGDDDFWGRNWTIWLDDREHYDWASRKDASVRIAVRHGIRKNMAEAGHPEHVGTISAVYENGGVLADIKKGFTSRKNYGLANTLLGYYAAETVIVVDEDDVVTSVGDY
jgi:hypothetical protein